MQPMFKLYEKINFFTIAFSVINKKNIIYFLNIKENDEM